MGWLGTLKVTGNSTYEFQLAFHSNYVAPCLRYSKILAENRRFNLPHLYLAPPLGLSRRNFTDIFGIKN